MAIIKTQRNTVYAYDRQPDDVLVCVSWPAPVGDGKHLRSVRLPYAPISEYAAAVDWAVGFADKMAHPIHVLPLNHGDIFNTGRFEPFRKFLANMNEKERAEVRQIIVDSWAAIMRDSNTPALRTTAFNMLAQLAVVTT
jgi:hypothetical protein